MRERMMMTSKIMSRSTDGTRWLSKSPSLRRQTPQRSRQTNREKGRAGQIYLPPDWDVKQSCEVAWPVSPVVRGNKQPECR